MPQPTSSDLHVNALLTNVSIAFIQSAEDFVADKVFPNVPVAKQSDRYTTYDRADFFRNEMRKRAPGTETAGGGYDVDTTPTYYCDVWGLHRDIDDQQRANADSVFDLDRDATIYLSQQALIRRDKQWVTNYFATGKWDVDLDGVSGSPGANQFKQWDASGSTPIKDLRTQIWAVKQLTGYKPNTLVLGPFTWQILQDHSDFLDRIKYTQRGMVTPDLLAAVLELGKVVIASGVEVTSDEGATDAFAFLAGKHALLAYAAPNPGLLTPTAGYTFSWTGYLGAGPQGNRVKQFRMEALASDRTELEMAFDMKQIASALGAFFESAVS